MSSKNHIHTYARVKGRPKQLRCIHPDCSHTTERELAIFKRALCPFCGEQYILTWRELRLAKPHCANCTRNSSVKQPTKPKVDLNAISQRLIKILTQEEESKGVGC